MPDLTPFWLPGNEFTGHCAGAVTGQRFVMGSGQPVDGNPGVDECDTAGAELGVAARDKVAGQKVLVFRGSSIVEVIAGATLTAHQQVMSDATGRAIPFVDAAGRIPAGRVLADAATGAVAMIALKL